MHRLNWLPLPCFIQFRSLCAMYHQYHKFKCILLKSPIIFWEILIIQEHLYILQISLCSAWVLHNVFFILKPLNDGIHCHLLWLIVLVIHFMSTWMLLHSIVTHCIDFLLWYTCIIVTVLFCFVTVLSLFCVVTVLSLSFHIILLVVACVCNIVCMYVYVMWLSSKEMKNGCSRLFGGKMWLDLRKPGFHAQL